MFTSPTQLPTIIGSGIGYRALARVATLRVKSSASSSALQTQLILVLACEAQRPAVLSFARNWEGHKQQPRCSESNRYQIAHSNHLSVLSGEPSPRSSFNVGLQKFSNFRHKTWAQ